MATGVPNEVNRMENVKSSDTGAAGKWESSLCGCTSTPHGTNDCVMAMFMPCLIMPVVGDSLGDIYKTKRKEPSPFYANGVVGFCTGAMSLTQMCISPCVITAYASSMQTALNMDKPQKKGLCELLATSVLCGPCLVAQMTCTMDKNTNCTRSNC